MTKAALETIRLETDYKKPEILALATETHRIDDITSKIASGSYRTDGMLVIPCSIEDARGHSQRVLGQSTAEGGGRNDRGEAPAGLGR